MADAYVRDGLPRAVLGILFVGAPARVARVISPDAAPERLRHVEIAIFALGARHLLETGALLLHPRPAVIRTIVGIDTLHATTMGVLACLSPTYRRPSAVSALTAMALAALALSALASRKALIPSGKDE